MRNVWSNCEAKALHFAPFQDMACTDDARSGCSSLRHMKGPFSKHSLFRMKASFLNQETFR